jgi:hypothetical protein
MVLQTLAIGQKYGLIVIIIGTVTLTPSLSPLESYRLRLWKYL